MGMEQLISIIVPVYNVKLKYYNRCITSILKQTYKNFECLIIDDGSSEENEKEYRKIIMNDSRFIYIKQDNAGVSTARNRGIKEAKGSYTCFVDSDDEVLPQFVEEAYVLAMKYKSDMVFGDIQNIPDQIKSSFCDAVCYFASEDLKTLKNDFISLSTGRIRFRTIHGSACSKLIRTDILKKHKFDSDIPYSEDLLFTRELMDDISSVVICPNKWYLYYQNEESATHSRPCSNYVRLYMPFWKKWHMLNMRISDEGTLKKMYRRNIDFYFTFLRLHVVRDKSNIIKKMLLLEKISQEGIFSARLYHTILSDYLDIETKIKYILLSKKMVILSYLIMKIKK